MVKPDIYDVFDKHAQRSDLPDNMVGKLPNGDLLVLNPDDHYIYQVDQINHVVLNPFCSETMWVSTYKPLFEEAGFACDRNSGMSGNHSFAV